jgi:alpha-amylase/alpha-mannosidase (GH57 family)
MSRLEETPGPPRYVCLHGHFYQPPRENPWTGVVERQPSAGEDHDWNVRIARECYAPNGAARVAGEGGETDRVVNNYARLSFNFGPTLLSWYEQARPDDYARLLEADAESYHRLDGHGNAIAQAYSHAILPLCEPADALTQVRWGLADFAHRFGRKPEALWLPECACDDKTLRLLADHKLKYAILSPSQAQRARPLGSPSWLDVSAGNLDTRRPYRWWAGAPGRSSSIDLFFYDGSLSQAVAFGRLMSDGERAAQQLERRFSDEPPVPELVSVATDGETYGHHEKFADLGLAWLLHESAPRRGLQPVNFGWYLERYPPTWQVELKAGPQGLGTAWSCAHGVGRWCDDCPCGAEEGGQTRWRRPLREALDWLRRRLANVFEGEGGKLLKGPWEARNDYVSLLLDGSPDNEEAFWARHLKPGASAGEARRLLEMQKFVLYSFTSCGWFFADVAGLEAVQNLKYAARALELAAQSGARDLEPEFLRLLARAPSNDARYGDAAGVYRALVRLPRAAAGL